MPATLPSRARRTTLAALGTLGAAALLAGCSALNTVTSDVSSFGDWPAGRSGGSFAFDRLPSQQAQAEQAALLEAAARGALEKAGFRPAAEGQAPDLLVQIAARTSRADRQPWADPLWWHGGFGYWRVSPWSGPYWNLGLRYEPMRYDREVAVLIRDRASGRPLYEARAANEGNRSLDRETAGAMFEAALMDFPRTGPNPRSVSVTLPGRP